MNTNFNFLEFNSIPVQYYVVDDPITILINPNIEQEVQIKVQSATSELLNNIFAYWEISESEFFRIGSIKQ